MEKRLFEHDRSFANRVSAGFEKRRINPYLLWPVAGFILGFAVLTATFRDSLLVATIGFLLMLLSAFVFEKNYRAAKSGVLNHANQETHSSRHKPISSEISVIAHKVTHLWRKDT